MTFEYIKSSIGDEAEKYSTEKGNWVIANVRQVIGWPEEKVIVYFREVPILFLPQGKDTYPAVAVLCKNDLSSESARETINHFLSSLAWSQSGAVAVEYWSGGSGCRAMGTPLNVRAVSKPFRIWYLPDSSDPATRLALAFYREALSLNHVAYSFLSYYKIINLKYKKGHKQKDWIESKLAIISEHSAKTRLADLIKSEGTNKKVAAYLYHSCRCAIAHADTQEETINPESYEDSSRLYSDLPLIKTLAEILIEEDFKILTRQSIYDSHIYELFGFKEIFSDEFIQKLLSGDKIEEIRFFNEITLRLWGERKYSPFEKMAVIGAEANKGRLLIQALSSSKKIQVIFALDYAEGRILFDPTTSISYAQDDGSKSIIEDTIDAAKFLRKYWCNGVLEIWEPKNNLCLGFSDPFVPVNIDLSGTIKNFDKQIQALEQELEKRKVPTPRA